jgi:hypothetical protein
VLTLTLTQADGGDGRTAPLGAAHHPQHAAGGACPWTHLAATTNLPIANDSAENNGRC